MAPRRDGCPEMNTGAWASARLLPVLLLVPILAGLLGAIWVAFDLAQGGNLVALRDLASWTGLPAALRLSLVTGLVATALSLCLTLLITATLLCSPAFAAVRRLLPPLLAMPHAAAALGMAFLLAPSGWIARILSPWATGWSQPPDLQILNDPWGMALTIGLTTKELPFLLLMTLAALPQCDAHKRMQLAATLGYGRVAGFWLTVTPVLYSQLRMPVYAVLAYAMTNVDMAMILGPTLPPTLAVQTARWMTDPDLSHRSLSAAAALAQLAATLVGFAGWIAAEHLATALRRCTIFRGLRLRKLDAPFRAVAMLGGLTVFALLVASLCGLTLWSVAGPWPFPGALPRSLTLTAWVRAAPGLASSTQTTALIASLSTGLALIFTFAALQAEFRIKARPLSAVWLYLPLILPQICFLPGIEHLLLAFDATGGIASVTATHLVFVLPYVWLGLAAPFRSWDARIATIAATLGASPTRIFWRLRLPMLLTPLLTAAAIGVAVSVGQYLPTLLIGGGRVTTLTTEALALASGGNRRLTAAYALLQSMVPALAFALAIAMPRFIVLRRKAGGQM